MGLGARIGWGIVIYSVVFLAWAGMGIYGLTQGAAPYFLEFVVLIVVCLWAGSELKFRNWGDILPYSVGWACIVAALDALYVVPLQGWGWYEQWTPWATYLLVIVVPLLSTRLRKRSGAAHGIWES